MSKISKLINRLLDLPSDMKFSEVETLLTHLGYKLKDGSIFGGSRVEFYKGNVKILFHKPHGSDNMKRYQLKTIIKILKKEEII